jgi:hypothetical protein
MAIVMKYGEVVPIVRMSVHSPDYDPEQWLIIDRPSGRDNTDVAALMDAKVSTIYWKNEGERIVEMKAAEKAAVDVLNVAEPDMDKTEVALPEVP